MKLLIDTNILYYLSPESKDNPLNPTKLYDYLKDCCLVMITQLNFAEFYTSVQINEKMKISILEKVKGLKFSIEEKEINDTISHLSEKIKKLKTFRKYHESRAGILAQKKDRENLILQEFFESILAIFAIYLTNEFPLTTNKQKEIFFKQFEALVVGNRIYNDSYISDSIKKLYDTKTNKGFRKDFIQQIFLMMFLLYHNFASSREEFFLLDENTTQNKLDKYNDFLEKNELFSKIYDIVINDLTLTSLPINSKNEYLANAVTEYKNFLPNFNYSDSYINLIALVFKNILTNGSKIDKNDAIDYIQFQYIDNFNFLTMETSLRNKLSLINPKKAAITEEIIKKCSD